MKKIAAWLLITAILLPFASVANAEGCNHNWSSIWAEVAHPHYYYHVCGLCGITEYTGGHATKNHGDGSWGSWTCPDCGTHTFTGQSCTSPGSCVCGATTPAWGHSYASTYLYTSPYHPHNNYFECTRCGYHLFAGTNEIKLHGNGTNNTCQQCPILDVSLLALKEYDNGTIVERNSYFNSVKSDLSNIGLDYQYENFFTLLSPISTLQTNMITRMQASELFFIHSHGTQNSIVIGIDNGNYYSLSSSDLCNVDLSELRLAVLLTCNGAAGDGTNYPENILEQMLCSGSETVLGFSSIARVGDCNLFAKRLVLRMTYNNESISDAVINMPYIGFLPQSQDIPFILDAVVIGGNDSLSL